MVCPSVETRKVIWRKVEAAYINVRFLNSSGTEIEVYLQKSTYECEVYITRYTKRGDFHLSESGEEIDSHRYTRRENLHHYG